MTPPAIHEGRDLPVTGPVQSPATGSTLVRAWQQRLDSNPTAVAITYFDGTLTARQVDQAANALAAAFTALGTARGDRVGVQLQNIPQYPLVLLALWKIGAAALLLNPMYHGTELRKLIDDSGAVGIVSADVDVETTAEALVDSSVRWMVSASALDFQTRNDPRVFADLTRARPAPQGDLSDLIERYRGTPAPNVDLAPDDLALLTYTSGTTGPAKGAMNTHANVLAVTTGFSEWIDLQPGDAVFATAPLFHITGAVINATIALLADTKLVLTNRFHPEVALDAFVEHGVTFTIGSITAFNAIHQVTGASREHFATMRALYSGGAPIPPATVDRFRDRFGVYIHNVYGMTETTSAVIAVPLGTEAPVHDPSGTLSIGVPLPQLVARVVGADGVEVPPGEQGELELSGPQVIPGYWQNPQATAATMPDGHLLTGDGAIKDRDGWIYLVDRLKDQINTSGYKVWPREVEDVLYAHPAVHEAAVVGRPDDYRGESVAGYVSLKAGRHVTERELIDFTREHLAAYKAPRNIHFLADLPKTQSGKIRRNVLRDSEGPTWVNAGEDLGVSVPEQESSSDS